MDSMTRHFGLKKAFSGFLLLFDFHPRMGDEGCAFLQVWMVFSVNS